jgi:NADH:ubiquinone oxidoreductase subunit 3 (subunit A)
LAQWLRVALFAFVGGVVWVAQALHAHCRLLVRRGPRQPLKAAAYEGGVDDFGHLADHPQILVSTATRVQGTAARPGY